MAATLPLKVTLPGVVVMPSCTLRVSTPLMAPLLLVVPVPDTSVRFLLLPVTELRLMLPAPVPVESFTVAATRLKSPPMVRLLLVVVMSEARLTAPVALKVLPVVTGDNAPTVTVPELVMAVTPVVSKAPLRLKAPPARVADAALTALSNCVVAAEVMVNAASRLVAPTVSCSVMLPVPAVKPRVKVPSSVPVTKILPKPVLVLSVVLPVRTTLPKLMSVLVVFTAPMMLVTLCPDAVTPPLNVDVSPTASPKVRMPVLRKLALVTVLVVPVKLMA